MGKKKEKQVKASAYFIVPGGEFDFGLVVKDCLMTGVFLGLGMYAGKKLGSAILGPERVEHNVAFRSNNSHSNNDESEQ